MLIKYILRDKPMFNLKGSTHIKRSYLITLMVSSLILFFFTGKNIQFTYPIDIFRTNFQYIEESHREITYLATPYSFRKNKKIQPNIFMLIIGEAARRTTLQAYGNPLPTTPELENFIKKHPDNVILFQNAVSASAYTRGSVPTMLSTYNVKHIKNLFARPSLSKMFRGAGYKTLYVTTRPKYLHRNLVSIFQDDAEKSVYLTKLTDKKYDEAALPVIKHFIDKYPDFPRFIVFHLMGSHIKYSMQYPKSEKYFNTTDSMIDSYNDSIRYSDKVIMHAVDIVMGKDVPAFVLYASDHGENLNDYGDGNFGHGTKGFTKFEFEIPFIIFYNDAFKKNYSVELAEIKKHIHQPLNQDYISHTFLSLADIKDPQFYSPENDLSSPDFQLHKRMIIDENMNLYDFDALNLDKRKVRKNKNEKN
jgi:heptose-I-phosphate ethanolaminephosphotransferase